MIKMKVQELKKFFSNSSSIKYSNGILPVLAYIKVEKSGKLIKTNLNAYIIQDITPVAETFLMHEETVSAFVKDCKSEEFDVEVKGKVVYLREGKREMKYQFSDASIYPETPEMQKSSEVRIEEKALKAIGIAAKNIGNNTGSNFDFVHLIGGWVIGSDNHRFYCYYIGEGLPNVLMSQTCANVISQFGGVSYYRFGNYDFYQIGSILYGFALTEHKTPNFLQFVSTELPKDFMEVDVEQVVNFCDTVISASPLKAFDCVFREKRLSFEDGESDFSGYNIELDTTGDFIPDVLFNPRIFGSFFKSLNYDYARLSPSKINPAALTVWNADDENFNSVVMGTLIPQ